MLGSAQYLAVAARIVGAVAFAVALPAGAEPKPCPEAFDAVWQPQAVAWPVAPNAVEPVAPWVPSSAIAHVDPVEVTIGRAAALWIPAATVRRVRVIRGEPGDLRLSRVGGSHAAKIVAEEPGNAVSGAVDLVEPVGRGSIWVIAAAAPTTIAVERVVPREPRLAWEAARDALLAWIDREDGGEVPELPLDDGGAAAIRLLGARALLAADMPAVVRSVIQLWRRIQVDSVIASLRPGNDPYVEHQVHMPSGPVTESASGEPYGPVPPGGRPWRLQLTGPGILVVNARATAAQARGGGVAFLEVRRSGVAIAHVNSAVTPVLSLEPGAAFPGAAVDAEPADNDSVLGRNIRAVVPLAMGTHVYEIAVAGAGLVRADARRRKPRLRQWLFDRDQRDASWARAKLASVEDPTARALGEGLLASALGDVPAGQPSATTRAALFGQLVAMPGPIAAESARSLVAKVAAWLQHAQGDLERAIVLELADRIPAGVDATPLAKALLAPGRPRPPPALLAALAPHLLGGGRSDGFAAAELAWRQHPTLPAFRAALLATASRSALQRIDPVLEPTNRATGGRWLLASDGRPAEEIDPAPDSIVKSTMELALGRDTELELAPHPTDSDRLAVVRVYVATPADAPGPVRVVFDGRSHPLLALKSLEVIEFAASPGRHVVRIEAPRMTRAFVAAPRRVHAQPTVEPGAAVVVKRWPVDETLVYALPSPRALGPVRIELVGLFANRPRRHVVWLHTETGPPRRLVLDVRAPDPTSWSLDDNRAYAPPAATWIWLPPSTRTFWLTTDEDPLFAHVSVHGPATEPVVATPEVPVPLPRAVGLERVAELSALIATHGDAAQHYVARALALVELGELGAARRDLAAAASRLGDDDRSAYDDARALVDTMAEPSYLPVQPPGGPIYSGVAMGPPTIAPEPELLGLARRVRRDGPTAIWTSAARGKIQIPSSLAGKHMAAMLAHLAGQSRAAVDRWLAIGSWQARVAALMELRQLLDRETAGAAPLAVGVAGELEDVGIGAVKHARAAAAHVSRWEPVRYTARSAGFESLATIPNQLDELPAALLRRALLGAPWRDAPSVLAPGRAVHLSIEGPRTVGVHVWCRRLWPADLPAECRLASTVDQAPSKAIVAPHGRVHSVAVDVPPGHHEIEVGLAASDPTAVAAVRFTDGRGAPSDPAIQAVRPAHVFLATKDRSAEIVVAGPGAIGVEVRGYAGSADVADIVVTGLGSERRVRVAVDKAPALETSATQGRDVSVTRPMTRTVLLPFAGSYAVSVTPSRDTIAVRFATRVATNPGPDIAPEQRVEVSDDGLAWPAAIPQPALVAGRETAPRWIPSVEGIFGQDSLQALDSDFAELDLRFELAAQLRRRGRDVSWFTELRGRRAGPLGPTARFRVLGQFRNLPFGLAASFDARAAAQTTSAGALWLLRGAGDVSRALPLTPRWQLVPQVALYAATFGPTQVPYGADPMVASSYRRDHPLQVAESLDLTGRPWADQVVSVGFTMRSNESPVSIDAVGARVMWRGLVETTARRGGIVMFEYAPTLRLADENRAYMFLRHDLAAEISWPLAIARGRYGRIAVALRGDLYPPTNISQMSHAVSIKLRWDGWHPGVRNRLPFEEPLSDFVDEVSWGGRR